MLFDEKRDDAGEKTRGGGSTMDGERRMSLSENDTIDDAD